MKKDRFFLLLLFWNMFGLALLCVATTEAIATEQYLCADFETLDDNFDVDDLVDAAISDLDERPVEIDDVFASMGDRDAAVFWFPLPNQIKSYGHVSVATKHKYLSLYTTRKEDKVYTNSLEKDLSRYIRKAHQRGELKFQVVRVLARPVIDSINEEIDKRQREVASGMVAYGGKTTVAKHTFKECCWNAVRCGSLAAAYGGIFVGTFAAGPVLLAAGGPVLGTAALIGTSCGLGTGAFATALVACSNGDLLRNEKCCFTNCAMEAARIASLFSEQSSPRFPYPQEVLENVKSHCRAQVVIDNVDLEEISSVKKLKTYMKRFR